MKYYILFMLCIFNIKAELFVSSELEDSIIRFNENYAAHFYHPNDLDKMRKDNGARGFLTEQIAWLDQDKVRRHIVNLDKNSDNAKNVVSFERFVLEKCYHVTIKLGKESTVEDTFFRIVEIVAIIRKINDVEKESEVDMSTEELKKHYPQFLFLAQKEIAKFHTGDYAKGWLEQYKMNNVINKFNALNEMTYEQWRGKQNEEALKIEMNSFCENWSIKTLE